jgi:hypothetical protein
LGQKMNDQRAAALRVVEEGRVSAGQDFEPGVRNEPASPPADVRAAVDGRLADVRRRRQSPSV